VAARAASASVGRQAAEGRPSDADIPFSLWAPAYYRSQLVQGVIKEGPQRLTEFEGKLMRRWGAKRDEVSQDEERRRMEEDEEVKRHQAEEIARQRAQQPQPRAEYTPKVSSSGMRRGSIDAGALRAFHMKVKASGGNKRASMPIFVGSVYGDIEEPAHAPSGPSAQASGVLGLADRAPLDFSSVQQRPVPKRQPTTLPLRRRKEAAPPVDSSRRAGLQQTWRRTQEQVRTKNMTRGASSLS
jgi:hypothetical protein